MWYGKQYLIVNNWKLLSNINKFACEKNYFRDNRYDITPGVKNVSLKAAVLNKAKSCKPLIIKITDGKSIYI